VWFCAGALLLLLASLLLTLLTLTSAPLTTATLFTLVVGGYTIALNPTMLLTSALAERFGRSQELALALSTGAAGVGAAAGAVGLVKVRR
jgi:predicted MFS family arabinose efflux permease